MASGESGFAVPLNIAPVDGELNFAPEATNDQFQIDEDTPLQGNVLTNDSDQYQGVLRTNTTPVVQPQHGTVEITENGQFVYTPKANFNGIDAFSYQVVNQLGMTDTALVEIIINAINDAPTALDNNYNITRNGSLSVPAPGLLANDSDIDSNSLSVDPVAVTLPTKGTLTLNIDGSFDYQGDANLQGVDSFQYRIYDSSGAQAIANVTIAGLAENNSPMAVNDNYNLSEDSTLVVNADLGLLANDSDPDNDSFTLDERFLISPNHGQLLLATDGSFSYIPDANYYGIDKFQYQIVDSLGATATASATLTINSVADNPVAQNDVYQFQYNQRLDVNTQDGLLSNDINVDVGELSINTTPVENVKSGTLTLNSDGSFSYQPNTNALDVDSFSYSVFNQQGLSATAQVILSKAGSNTPARAVNDQYSLLEDSLATQLDVLANDIDVDGDAISITNISTTTGTARIINNKIEFTPPANFFGEVKITYSISDGLTNNPPTTATAIATITVLPINDTPIALADTTSIIEDSSPVLIDVLANDSDIDGDSLSIVNTTTNLGFVDIVDNKVQYSPIINSNGVALVTYTITDGNGGTATANLVINISAVNDAPSVSPDIITLIEDSPATLIDVLANDSDVDGDTLTIINVSTSADNATVFNNQIRFTPVANDNGIIKVNYIVSDGITTASSTLTINITPVNDTPIANSDSATIEEDQISSIDVLTNDSDIEGDALTITNVIASVGNAAVVNNQIEYTPASNFNGTATVNYTVSDGTDTAAGELTITVTSVNDAPIANADTATLLEDALATSIDVLSNDTDVENDTLSITAATATSGAVSFSGSDVIYTPNSNFNGTATVNYTVSDGTDSAAGELTITVTSVNDAPVANSDSVTILEDALATTIDVLSNDTDIENDTISITAATATSGAVSFSGSDVIYTPASDFNGTATVNYTVSDGTDSAAGELTITVTSVNDTPVANTDTATLLEDASATTIDVLSNDTDVDGDTLSITAASATSGAVSFSGSDVIYTPASDFNGTATVNYTVSDGIDTTGGELTITVTSVNDAPVANSDSVTILEDALATTIDVLSNDTDIENDTLSITAATATSGAVSFSGSDVIYTPASDFNGTATVNYTVSDGIDTTGGELTITVTPVNDAPVANADIATILEDASATTIDVLSNDTDVDGDTLSITAASATSGAVSFSGSDVIYTPNSNFNGTATVNYTVSDGTDSAAGELTITVTSVNDAPVANADIATILEDASATTIDVLSNDTDVDGDTLSITAATATSGAVSFSGSDVIYTPASDFNGTATVNYTVSDGTDTAAGELTITVTSVNDAPIASADAFTILEDASATTIDVLSNDTDVENDTLSITAASATSGAVSFSGSDVIYTPASDFNGTATVNYTVSDGTDTAAGELTITVTSVNDAPIANADTATLLEDALATTIDVLSNDTDVDGDTLSITAASATSGAVSFSGSDVIYTPASDFNGTATVNYTVSDGIDTTGGELTITVTPVNDAPVANSDSVTILEDALATTIDVLSNDTDVENDTLSITAASATSGAVSFSGSDVVYTPASDFNGTATVNYTVSDGTDSAAGELTITVTSVNDAPVATVDAFTILEDALATTIDVLSNDTDVDGDTLSITAASATSGAVSFSGSDVIYTPNSNFNGTATVNYTVSDGTDTAAGELTITVSQVNDTPIALDQSFSIGETATNGDAIGTLVASDIENHTLSFSLSSGDIGLFTLNSATGLLTANGVSPFDYETSTQHTIDIDITDDGTPTTTTTITVTVTVLDEDDPLEPVEDSNFGRPLTGQLELANVFSDGEFTDSIVLNNNLYFVGYTNNVDKDIMIASYTSAGAINTAFDGDGIKVIDLNQDEEATAIVSGNGDLFIAFSSSNGSNTEACLMKISTTGIVSNNSGDANTGIRCTTLSNTAVTNDLEFTDNKIQAVGHFFNGQDKDSLWLKYDAVTLAFEDSPKIVDVSGADRDDEAYAINNFGNSDLMVVGSVSSLLSGKNSVIRHLQPNGNDKIDFNGGSPLLLDLSENNLDDELQVIGGIDAPNFTAYLGGYKRRSNSEKEAILTAVDNLGNIQLSIGDNGIETYNIDSDSDEKDGGATITGIDYEPINNQLILSGSTGVEATDIDQNINMFSARVLIGTAELDNTYADSGINIISTVLGDQIASSLSIDENDTLWLAGRLNDASNEPFITAVNGQQSLFTDFEEQGYASLNSLSIVANDQSMNVLQLTTGAHAGKFILASRAEYAASNKLVLTRFTANGLVDTSFSLDGSKALNINVSTDDFKLLELSDGSIVIAGTKLSLGDKVGFVTKVNQEGIFDYAFATNGIYSTTALAGTDVTFLDVARDSSDNIVAVGSITTSGVTRSFATMLKDSGSLEGSFGISGEFIGNTNEIFESLYIDANKDIFVGGKLVFRQ